MNESSRTTTQRITSGLLLALCCATSAADEPAKTSEADSRMKVMMDFAKSFKGTRSSDGSKIIPLDKALLRWTNPYSNVKDGILAGWVDDAGCPAAIAQIYLLPDRSEDWGIELQSLTQKPIKISCEEISIGPWRPNQPGVEWKPLNIGKAAPAGTERRRLSQMRLLARRFRCKDTFEETDDSQLRLLPEPVMRYSDSKRKIIDGAVFALVHGTDPELIIMIEAREKQDGTSAFQYALAPMTGYELKAYLDDELVYHKPLINSNLDTDIFWQRNLVDTPRAKPGFFERLFNGL